MKLPQLVDYRDAMVAPSVSLIDPVLRQGTPRRNPLGLPSPISGGFALTFDVRVGEDRYAVRCFHKDRRHLRERYARVAEFVRASRLPFLVEVDYLPDGIRVGGGVFPIVRMRWVEGARLDDWIDDHLHDPAALDGVRRGIASAVDELRRHDAAHGDLQHGNVLVRPDGSIRLVDYDGMYLPQLHGYGSSEEGNRNYQHPERGRQFDPSLDLFSAAAIDLSLRAVAHDPTLWPRFNEGSGERLLFSADDFADPSASELFDRLDRVSELAEPAGRLRTACVVPVDDVPAALSGTLTVAVPQATDRRPRRVVVPGALAAIDRRTLLARQGDHVTVVGRVVAVRRVPVTGGTASTVMSTVISFGDHRAGALTVVAWDKAGRDLGRVLGDLKELREKWVEVTGLLTVHHNGTLGVDAPQIELQGARSITRLSVFEARRRLNEPAPPEPAPAARPAPPRRPDDLDGRLGRLYSSSTFTSRRTPPATPSPTASPVAVASSVISLSATPTAVGVPAATLSPAVPPAPARPPGGPAGWPVGVRALALAVCCPPAGLVLAIVVLADHAAYSERDRTHAAVALSMSLLVMLLVAMLLR